MSEATPENGYVEWDVDNNVPMYTRDYLTMGQGPVRAEGLCDAALMISDKEVPVFAIVNGEKTRVGTGRIDRDKPEGMIFTTTFEGFDASTPVYDYLAALPLDEEGYTNTGFVFITEVTLQHGVEIGP